MEFHEDLQYWHTHGYFYEMNTQIACPLMENLIATFEGLEGLLNINNQSFNYIPPKAMLHFGHTDGILLFLSLLGLNKDDYSLNHDMFEESKYRKFRLSKIDPMSSNVGFLLLECEKSPLKRILTFFQEKPIKLPKCNALDCDYEIFKKIYENDIQCKFDNICENTE